MGELNNSGKPSQAFEKSEYTWTLHKYTEISNEYKEEMNLESPIFPKGEQKYKWMLDFYPNGDGIENYVMLSLRLLTESSSETTVKYTFTLRNTSGDLIVQRVATSNFMKGQLNWGYVALIPCDELISSINKDDILHIHVSVLAGVIEEHYHMLSTLKKNKRFRKLSSDLGDMFKSNEFKDFTLKFNDKTEVSVHRNVLAARSPVFAAMFRHDTSENNLGCTDIVGIDKNTMMKLLTFIYTGDVDLSEEEAVKLLPAADKYEVIDLKECCSVFLKDSLTELNALDILIFAETHNISYLKQAVFDYISAEFKKFAKEKCLNKLKPYPDLLVAFGLQIFNLFQEKSEN